MKQVVKKELKARYKILSKYESQYRTELLKNFFNPRGIEIRKFILKHKTVSALSKNLSKLKKILDKYEKVYHHINIKYWVKCFNLIKQTKLRVKNSLFDFSKFFKKETNITELKEQIFKKDKNIALKIMNKMFKASHKTLQRVNQQVMDIIGAEIYEGKGINQTAEFVMMKYNNLKRFEAIRIARTETHVVMNTTQFEEFKQQGVSKIEWLCTNDERTRPSHRLLNGEIVKLGEPFSNGLLHPCDTDGDIEEWINCRCTLLSVYD